MQRIPAFKSLDVFRGFSALWVVMVHSSDRWITNPDSPYLKEPLYAFSIRGQLGVIIFFVISGYCITATAYSGLVSGKTVGRYSFERVRRIYPPYLAAVALGILSLLLFDFLSIHNFVGHINHLDTYPLDTRFWLGNLFLLQYELHAPLLIGVFWSLGYEVAFYVIIGILLACAKTIAAKRDTYAGTIFLVASLGIGTTMTLGWLLRFGQPIFPIDCWHYFALGGLVFFLLDLKPGTVAKYTRSLRWIAIANVLVVTAMTLLLTAFRTIGTYDFGHPSSKVRALVCLGFCALLIVLRPFDEKFSSLGLMRPFMWIGAFSYSLYLVHPVVIPYVDALCRKAGLTDSKYWIAEWIEVAVGLVFGRIFFLVVEKRFISKRQAQRIVAEHVGLLPETQRVP